MNNKIDIMDVKFNNVSMDSAVELSIEHIRNKQKGYVVTPNAEIAYMCRDDLTLKNIVNNAFLTLPDGIGVVYAAKILKTPVWGKVAGVEYADNLMGTLEKNDMSIFFLGGKPNVGQKAAENILKKYPNLKIVGIKDGYFKSDEEAISAINEVSPDVVFCCLGAPRQEIFMSSNIDKTNCKIMCGLGGSLDVFAGEVKRAPKIFIKLGLEWFYRLLKQPSRFGRMMKLPLYMLSVIKYKFTRKGTH